MSMLPLLLCLSSSVSVAVGVYSSDKWHRARDDLSGDYTAIGSVAAASRISCCSSGMGAAHAVQFDEAQRLCRLFVCRGGWHGCRKCRNADNSSLPQVWVRKLGDRRSCWRTFQHRVDASVDFNKNWTQFVSGFGQGESANFWIGLQNLHLMTRDSGLPVRWEFSDWNGTLHWMENAFFQVGDAATKFRASVGEQLIDRSTVTQCSGADHQFLDGKKFTTKDQDNDLASFNCAVKFGGGWWMGDCFCWSPNGPYVSPPEALRLTNFGVGITLKDKVSAYPWNYVYSLKTFECLLLMQFE